MSEQIPEQTNILATPSYANTQHLPPPTMSTVAPSSANQDGEHVPEIPSPSPTLAQLLAEAIPIQVLHKSAVAGYPYLSQQIQEAKLALFQLGPLIESCQNEDDPSTKTIQEEGHYTRESREWANQLATLEKQLIALSGDVCHLPMPIHFALRLYIPYCRKRQLSKKRNAKYPYRSNTFATHSQHKQRIHFPTQKRNTQI